MRHRPSRRSAKRKGKRPLPTPISLPPKNHSPSAKSDEAKARAEEQRLKAATKATEAAAKLDTVKAEAMPKIDAASKAAEAAKEAATKKADTAKAANDAKLALEPVSIYISRAKQKLYVRRNTHKPWPDGGEVFDATIEVPVAIRDPDRPIGTHVFTAMASNDAGLRWSVVTIENGDGAKEALDRITIPQDVIDRIGPDRPAAILDHHLGRAAEPRNQLSHRVRCRSERPTPGRLYHAQADDLGPASELRTLGGRRLLQLFGPPPSQPPTKTGGAAETYQAQKKA